MEPTRSRSSHQALQPVFYRWGKACSRSWRCAGLRSPGCTSGASSILQIAPKRPAHFFLADFEAFVGFLSPLGDSDLLSLGFEVDSPLPLDSVLDSVFVSAFVSV